MNRLWFLIVAALASVTVRALQPQDHTLTANGSGSVLVEAVVSRLRSACLLAEDKLFLRRLAYVQSQDGLNPRAVSSHGGIWQVTAEQLQRVKGCGPSVNCSFVRSTFNIEVSQITSQDLQKPFYSGLVIALYIKSLSLSIPSGISAQANFYNSYISSGSSLNNFSSLANQLDQGCHGKKIDLTFVIDGSGSIGSRNFVVIKNFVKLVVSSLNIGANETQVAVIVYSSSSQVAFGLQNYASQTSILTAIGNIRYPGGGTNTAAAINMATNSVFGPNGGARLKSAKVLVVVTDGRSNNYINTVQAAEKAKGQQINVYSVGVGGGVNHQELRSVASSPSCTHVYLIHRFNEFSQIVRNIQKDSCEAPIILPENDTSIHKTLGNETITVTIKANSGNSTQNTTVVVTKAVCAIVHVYASYRTIRPSAAFYDYTGTAIDRKPSVISIQQATANGRALYLAVTGAKLDTSQGVSCEASFNITVTDRVPGVKIICKENGVERECSKEDILQSKFQDICDDDDNITNPCTQENLAKNLIRFAHPRDDRKFIQCDRQGKMYVTKCPKDELYNQEQRTCRLNGQDEGNNGQLLAGNITNPCTALATSFGHFYFSHPDSTKFIQCNEWGDAWVMPCATGTVWNQTNYACSFPSSGSGSGTSTGCITNSFKLVPNHPGKYQQCGAGGKWVDKQCTPGLVFDLSINTCNWPKSGSS